MAVARKATDAPQPGHAIEPAPCARRVRAAYLAPSLSRTDTRYHRLKIGGTTIEDAVWVHSEKFDAIAVDGKVVP